MEVEVLINANQQSLFDTKGSFPAAFGVFIEVRCIGHELEKNIFGIFAL